MISALSRLHIGVDGGQVRSAATFHFGKRRCQDRRRSDGGISVEKRPRHGRKEQARYNFPIRAAVEYAIPSRRDKAGGYVRNGAPLACAGAAPSAQYFRVTQRHGVWWLVDPAGHRFISKGVDNTGFFPTPKHTKAYGLPAKQSAVAQLLRWGFNTTGAFGDKLVSISVHGRGMDTTPILWLGSRFTWQYHYSKQFPDVFSPQFKVVAYRSAKEQCAKWKNNLSIGWFFWSRL